VTTRAREAGWEVLPHEPLQRLEENLWWLQGSIKVVPLPRCMTVVRLRNGDVLVHNAIAVDDETLEHLESLGPLRWVVAPNRYHRMDVAGFKARYPQAHVVCPRGATRWVAERTRVDMDYERADEQLRDDPTISLHHLAGVGSTEGVISVRSEAGLTLVFNDTLFNLEAGPGLFWLIYGRLLRHAGRPQVPNAFGWVLLEDKAVLTAHLHELAETSGLRRLIPGHGRPIDEDAKATLHRVANAV
jgi:hypothetical protein